MSQALDIWKLVNRAEAPDVNAVRERFQSADPFPHAIIDNFFTADFLARLKADFPQEGDAYREFCKEDDGRIGGNYANGVVSSFPPAFALLDRLVESEAFRRHVSALTGIDKLEYDVDYFGGGIRESRTRTFLPPHLDFNYHPKTKSHRRLNLLFYLNETWQEEWGGNLQVHKDPNVFVNDSLVAQYMPIDNRCLVFETSEVSWHSFDRLQLPEGKTRRAFTIYYYTKHRPNEEAIKFHNTEYVELPVPDHIRAGHTLTEDDVRTLQEGFARRDGRIRMLYDLRAEHDGKMRHVWNEYEYYLNLSKKLAEEKPLASAGEKAARKFRQWFGG